MSIEHIQFSDKNGKRFRNDRRTVRETIARVLEPLQLQETVIFTVHDRNPKKANKTADGFFWNTASGNRTVCAGPYIGTLQTATLTCEQLFQALSAKTQPKPTPVQTEFPKMHQEKASKKTLQTPEGKKKVLLAIFANSTGGTIPRPKAVETIKSLVTISSTEAKAYINALLEEALLTKVLQELAFTAQAHTWLEVPANHPDLIPNTSPQPTPETKPAQPQPAEPPATKPVATPTRMSLEELTKELFQLKGESLLSKEDISSGIQLILSCQKGSIGAYVTAMIKSQWVSKTAEGYIRGPGPRSQTKTPQAEPPKVAPTEKANPSLTEIPPLPDRISEIPAYIENLTHLEETLQNQITLIRSNLEKARKVKEILT